VAFRNHLNVLQRWIGRAGANDATWYVWPPRSPDLTPCDILWGYRKKLGVCPASPTIFARVEEVNHNCHSFHH
jgi:hypothetical protein